MQRKDKIELVITLLLAIILIMVTARALGKKEKGPLETSTMMKTSTNSTIVEADPLYERLEEEAQQMSLKRDPFTKVSEPQESKVPVLQLKGIFWDNQKPTAIINDQIVEVGDKIFGHEVVFIREDRVILNDGLRHFELILEEETK